MLLAVKIGQIARTKKSIITNGVINDLRIMYIEWAKREKRQSFAGYPLLHKGEIIVVVQSLVKRNIHLPSLRCLAYSITFQ
jgi:hypothetical protein